MGRGADSRAEFIARLKRVLQDSFAIFRKVLIVIEDAQQLNPTVLAEAAALCDFESAGRKRLKTIFVAPLEFDEMLRREENRGVLAAITTRCRLEPLAEEETAHYIAHRLEKAGAGGQVFGADAVHEVFVLSKGVPRLINLVCDHALLYGYSSDLKVIDAGVVRDCRRDLASGPGSGRRSARRNAAVDRRLRCRPPAGGGRDAASAHVADVDHPGRGARGGGPGAGLDPAIAGC